MDEKLISEGIEELSKIRAELHAINSTLENIDRRLHEQE